MMSMRPKRIEPGPGQESVWDYPRPPRLEPTDDHIVVAYGDVIVADTRNAQRLLETSQPPAYYIPPADVNTEVLTASLHRSFCEWKGQANYYDLSLPAGPLLNGRVDQVGWGYQTPSERYQALAGHFAFYAQMLACSVNGELVQSNEGDFYGGWITSKVVGPFKGGPGSSFW